MRKNWQHTITEVTLIFIGIGFVVLKENKYSTATMVAYTLLLGMIALGLILLIQSKSFWRRQGYTFASAEVTSVAIVQVRTGETNFIIKPGIGQFALLEVSLRYTDTENKLVEVTIPVEQKSWFRYLTDIDSDHYKSRTPHYQVGDALIITFKNNNPSSVKIW